MRSNHDIVDERREIEGSRNYYCPHPLDSHNGNMFFRRVLIITECITKVCGTRLPIILIFLDACGCLIFWLNGLSSQCDNSFSAGSIIYDVSRYYGEYQVPEHLNSLPQGLNSEISRASTGSVRECEFDMDGKKYYFFMENGQYPFVFTRHADTEVAFEQKTRVFWASRATNANEFKGILRGCGGPLLVYKSPQQYVFKSNPEDGKRHVNSLEFHSSSIKSSEFCATKCRNVYTYELKGEKKKMSLNFCTSSETLDSSKPTSDFTSLFHHQAEQPPWKMFDNFPSSAFILSDDEISEHFTNLSPVFLSISSIPPPFHLKAPEVYRAETSPPRCSCFTKQAEANSSLSDFQGLLLEGFFRDIFGFLLVCVLGSCRNYCGSLIFLMRMMTIILAFKLRFTSSFIVEFMLGIFLVSFGGTLLLGLLFIFELAASQLAFLLLQIIFVFSEVYSVLLHEDRIRKRKVAVERLERSLRRFFRRLCQWRRNMLLFQLRSPGFSRRYSDLQNYLELPSSNERDENSSLQWLYSYPVSQDLESVTNADHSVLTLGRDFKSDISEIVHFEGFANGFNYNQKANSSGWWEPLGATITRSSESKSSTNLWVRGPQLENTSGIDSRPGGGGGGGGGVVINSAFLKYCGIPVNYIYHGDRGCLVCLFHQFGGSSFTWRYLLPLLSSFAHTLSFDRVAHGFTARPVPGTLVQVARMERETCPYSCEFAVLMAMSFLRRFSRPRSVSQLSTPILCSSSFTRTLSPYEDGDAAAIIPYSVRDKGREELPPNYSSLKSSLEERSFSLTSGEKSNLSPHWVAKDELNALGAKPFSVDNFSRAAERVFPPQVILGVDTQHPIFLPEGDTSLLDSSSAISSPEEEEMRLKTNSLLKTVKASSPGKAFTLKRVLAWGDDRLEEDIIQEKSTEALNEASKIKSEVSIGSFDRRATSDDTHSGKVLRSSTLLAPGSASNGKKAIQIVAAEVPVVEAFKSSKELLTAKTSCIETSSPLDGTIPIVLVGCCSGCSLAIECAIRAGPSKVCGLVLISPAIFQDSEVPEMVRVVFNARLSNSMTRAMLISELSNFMLNRSYCDSSKIDKDTIDGYRLPLLKEGWVESIRQLLHVYRPLKVYKRLHMLKIPILIITGQYDNVTPKDEIPKLLRYCTWRKIRYVIRIIPNSGSLPHEEKPDIVANDIRNFIRSVVPDSWRYL